MRKLSLGSYDPSVSRASAVDLNFLDRAISYFSPAAGLRRTRARVADSVLRGYEGASKSKRTSAWNTPSTSAVAETFTSIEMLRNRARALVRDNPYASKGVQVIESNLIGHGMIPKPIGNEAATKIIKNKWDQWGESTECDADGVCDFYGLERLCVRSLVESGEVFIRRRPRRSRDGLAVPLQIQVLESDFLDSTKNETLSNGNRVIQGIEFNSVGRRVGYWMYPEHPGGRLLFSYPKSQRIPASDICHLYRVDRPGQVRGVSWFAPVIIRFREFDELEDAQLVRHKIAAMFAAYWYTTDEPGDEENMDGDEVDIEKITPGTIQKLPPGSDMKFASPPSVEGYSDFTRVTLTGIASGLGISYESLTSDLSNVNFSSGRMGWLEMGRNITSWRWLTVVPQFCNPVYQWFLDAGELAGHWSAEGIKAKWSEPKREQIDPVKETNGDILAVQSGRTSQSAVIRSYGDDPDEVMSELAEEREKMKILGIKTTSNPSDSSSNKPEQGVAS